jgi:hypothetical protein
MDAGADAVGMPHNGCGRRVRGAEMNRRHRVAMRGPHSGPYGGAPSGCARNAGNPFRGARCRWAAVACGIVTLAGVGCAQRRPPPADVPATVRGPVPVAGQATVSVFFVDGIARDRFDALVAAGRLPRIAERFVRGGVRVDNAVSSLPSVTYANAVSLITGRFPAHHGILGNQWFDRDMLMLRDYGFAKTYRSVNEDFTAVTLYDLLAGEPSVNVQGHTRRGVTHTIDNWAESGIDWFLRDYSDVDARVGTRAVAVTAWSRRKGRWPSVYLSYFPGLDEIGHRFGSTSQRYADALVTVDTAIGRILDEVESQSQVPERYHVLVTDHGHVAHPPGRVCDLAAILENHFGLRVHQAACQQRTRKARAACLGDADAVLISGAFRCGIIHLRGPGGWSSPPPRKRVDNLLHGDPAKPDALGLAAWPGVRLVCARSGPDAVEVVARSGRCRIERRSSPAGKAYRVVDGGDAGGDPLGYRTHPRLAKFVSQGWHSSADWLAATAAEPLPDFVPQVVELFDAPRAGDVVVFADADWTFTAGWRGGHGSCLARDMHVPLYFAGPGLTPGATIPHARLVDITPTIIDLLSHGERMQEIQDLDGVSLVPQLRAARMER